MSSNRLNLLLLSYLFQITSLLAQPIVFTQQPQSQEVAEGGYLTLSYAATGSILNATWYRNGINLLATNTTYTVPIAQTSNAGDYYVILGGNGVMAATSQVATVKIRPVGANSTWLGRAFVKVADDSKMAVPGNSNHVFTNWANPTLQPLLTFRDGKIHFVAGTSAGVRSLFRWTNGLLSTLVFTNTARPEGGTFADVFYPTDEGNSIVNFTATGLGMYGISNGVIRNVINTNTPVPERTANRFGFPGSYGRRGAAVVFSSAIQSIANGMFVLYDPTNLFRICDETTDLPGAMTGYGGRPTANSVNFDGTTMVFSTVSIPTFTQGGFYKVVPGGNPAGVTIKLADFADLRPGSTTQTFSNFGDIDVDGGLIFAVANNIAYKFEADGSVTNIASANYISAAGARQAYYGNVSFLARWFDGTNAAVLSNGSTVDGKSIMQILAADGQGDDVAVLLKFTDNSEGIYIAFGTTSAQPVITVEPSDFNVVDNGSTTFAVSAAGQGPLSYQWSKDGAPLANGTNAVLQVNNVQANEVGGYSVVVRNANGSATSRTAQLTRVIPPVPIILSGPTYSGTSAFGGNATLRVTVAGAAPLTYFWFKDATNIPGVNEPSLTLTNLNSGSRGNYSVIVSNANGTVTSAAYPLVSVTPRITQQPVGVTNSVGGTATFTVAAEGILPLIYQWQRSTPAPVLNIAGATNTTFTINNLSLTNAGNYRVSVTTPGVGIVVSSAVPLVVLSGNPNTPGAPQLQSPRVVSGQFQFQLATQTGFSYQVQSKTNLTDVAWTTEQTIPGDGTAKTVTSGGAASAKFIRVAVQ